MEVAHTNLSMHWMFHAYLLCTGTCLEVEMKGLVVSVFFSSVPGEHLTWHKKLTSAGNLPVSKAHHHFLCVLSIGYSLGITRIFKINIKVCSFYST